MHDGWNGTVSPLHSTFLRMLRVGLAGLFLYAGAAKLRDPSAFVREIANYQFLPELAPHVAATLPSIEIVAALALLLPAAPWRRAGALLTFGMLVAFLVGVTSVVLRGVNIDCGCFGSGSGSVTWWTVARNAVLSAAALYLVLADRGVADSREGARLRGAGAGEAAGDSESRTRPG